jgi:hypothetical protein
VSLIEKSEEIELLGMKVKEDHTFSKHIEEVIRAINTKTGILGCLAYHISHRDLKQVAEGICTSKLRYGLAAYGIPQVKVNEPKTKKYAGPPSKPV